MISVFVAICVGIAVSSAAPAGPPHHPGPDHHKLMPYAYQYGVKDEYHGVNFGENKESDGKVVHGSYHVLLPDGRIQNVKYTSDHYGGYIADVSYEGHAAPYHPPAHPKPATYHPPAPIHPGPHKG